MRPVLRQHPEEVAAEEPLRQRLLPRADREVNLVRRRELLRDLIAGVPPADTRTVPSGHVAGRMYPVLWVWKTLGCELARELRHVGALKWPGGDDNLVGSRRRSSSPTRTFRPQRQPSAPRYERDRRSKVAAYCSR